MLVMCALCPVAKKAKNAQRSTDYKAHYFANDRAFFILFSRFTPVVLLIRCLREFRINLNSARNISAVTAFSSPD